MLVMEYALLIMIADVDNKTYLPGKYCKKNVVITN